MDCGRILEVLEDYQYGELDGAAALEVSRHLRACANCSGAYRELEREALFYDRCREEEARELSLSPEIWRRVNARILSAGPAARDPSRFWQAASFGAIPLLRPATYAVAVLFVLVIGGIFLIRTVKDGGLESREVKPVAEVAQAGRAGTSFQEAMMAIQRAEKEYIEAIRILSEITEKRKPSLDPALVARMEKNLAAIDEAIESTRRAYRERPGDPDLALYMLHAYARKVELLQELSS